MATQLRELDVNLITRGHLERGVDKLSEQFAGIFSVETIERYVVESLETLPGKRFDELRAAARAPLRARAPASARTGRGHSAKDVPEVLFVCVHNAGRSQMAAALLDRYAEGRVHVRSAGSTPADEINPEVVTAMDELGVDLGKEFPKPLTDEFVAAADVVITMGCGDACPIYPGKRYEDWELADPAEADTRAASGASATRSRPS